jgi:hypothetical protein
MNNSEILHIVNLTFINIVRWRAGGVHMRTERCGTLKAIRYSFQI